LCYTVFFSHILETHSEFRLTNSELHFKKTVVRLTSKAFYLEVCGRDRNLFVLSATGNYDEKPGLGIIILNNSKCPFWSSLHGSVVRKLIGIHEVAGSILGLAQWVKDPALP